MLQKMAIIPASYSEYSRLVTGHKDLYSEFVSGYRFLHKMLGQNRKARHYRLQIFPIS